MSVYLYNLIFSLSGSNYTSGRFQPYNSTLPNPTIYNQSSAWFKYVSSGTPSSLGDYFAPVTAALTSTDWASPQDDSGSLQLDVGDYLMMRVSSLDVAAGTYRVRFTGVFGRGLGQSAPAGADELQSPLVMSTPTSASSLPRTVIDVDVASGSTPGSSWPGPIAADNSWVNWLGAVHAPADAAANDYTFNVGVSVYNGSVVYTFGKDPRLHVGMGMKGTRSEFAA
jgi:hypothetical protein